MSITFGLKIVKGLNNSIIIALFPVAEEWLIKNQFKNKEECLFSQQREFTFGKMLPFQKLDDTSRSFHMYILGRCWKLGVEDTHETIVSVKFSTYDPHHQRELPTLITLVKQKIFDVINGHIGP